MMDNENSNESEIEEQAKPLERVYLVDDTKIFLKLFDRYLVDYDVTTFLDPVEAFEAIVANPPDIVLSDLEMPVLKMQLGIVLWQVQTWLLL